MKQEVGNPTRKSLSFKGDAEGGQGEKFRVIFSPAHDRKPALLCSVAFSFVFVGELS